MEYTAIIKQNENWWIGWIEEIPGINCQERTHDDLINTLKVAVKEAVEFNKQDAIKNAGKEFQEEIIAV